jgi:hypothetical protein
MLYHYTDRISAGQIQREGLIRASPLTLHRDLLARDRGMETPPAVWLTVSATPEPTVVCKLRAAGWTLAPGDVWRITVPPDYPPAVSLPEWTERIGLQPADLRWLVTTAALVGSDWRDWRIVPASIPACDWVHIEPIITT